MRWIDPNGALQEPEILFAVFIWTLFLGLATSVGVRVWHQLGRQHERSLGVSLVIVAFVAALYAATPWSERALQGVMSRMNGSPSRGLASDERLKAGPPLVPAYAFGLLCGAFAVIQPTFRTSDD